MFYQVLILAFFMFGLGESWNNRHHPCSHGFWQESWWAIIGLLILFAGGFFDELIYTLRFAYAVIKLTG